MRCVLPVLTLPLRDDPFLSMVLIKCSRAGNNECSVSSMDEIQMAVGITSLLLWLMLTWSLGFILIRAFLEAIVAMTSLAFMLVLVPEPV